jgi:hypothetical protein
VEEVTFHNYRVIGGNGPNSNTTTPKDNNLDPIQSYLVPQTVTQLKALLGATQQMVAYVPYYALIASPLHALTKKDRAFPVGKKGISGSDYDLAYHHVKSLILDRPLYLWNKSNRESISSSKSRPATTDGAHARTNTQTKPHLVKKKENTIY